MSEHSKCIPRFAALREKMRISKWHYFGAHRCVNDSPKKAKAAIRLLGMSPEFRLLSHAVTYQ
jgi:hypothetical protein